MSLLTRSFGLRMPPFILVLMSTHIILFQVELEKLRLLCERVIKREKVKVCIPETCTTYVVLKVELYKYMRSCLN